MAAVMEEKGSFTEAKRTFYCGEARTDHNGQEVVLKGWVGRRRDHGGVIFVDLRDHTGIVQVVISPEAIPAGCPTPKRRGMESG